MNNPTFITIFRALSKDGLPDVHSLDDRLQVFWTLAAAKSEPSLDSLTATQIASILQTVCGIDITRQRVSAIAERSRKAVSLTKRKGVRQLKLMKLGEDELLKNSAEPIFVDPDKPFSSRRKVDEIFKELEGDARVCDTYFGTGALDFLAHSTKASSFRVLTENVQDSGRVKRDIAAFTKEHNVPLEVRVSKPGQLHDRYVLHREGMLLIGASLKDLGKKQSTVVALSATFAAEMGRAFDREWARASKLV